MHDKSLKGSLSVTVCALKLWLSALKKIPNLPNQCSSEAYCKLAKASVTVVYSVPVNKC